jgi:hypothetical protein
MSQRYMGQVELVAKITADNVNKRAVATADNANKHALTQQLTL